MKKTFFLTAIALIAGLYAASAAVHQSASGDKAYIDNDNAVAKGKAETKDFDGTSATRVSAGMSQWGFVTYWMGIPTPEGAATIRIRLHNDGGPFAKYIVYVRESSGQKQVGTLAIPAETPAGESVDVDFPVKSSESWSGIIIKKADKTELPGPWIENISVLVD